MIDQINAIIDQVERDFVDEIEREREEWDLPASEFREHNDLVNSFADEVRRRIANLREEDHA